MAKTTLTADARVLEILGSAEITDQGIRLTGQLDRPDYDAINKFLTVADCKWSRKDKMHVFTSESARQKIVALLDTGTIRDDKKHFQAYYTPASLADLVVMWADVRPGDEVLEPSAGDGAIAMAARRVGVDPVCVELNPQACDQLEKLGFVVKEMDFLTTIPAWLYDKVIMNPPFTGDQDIAHVRHAYDFLKPGGQLVAIMSKGFTFGRSGARAKFREWFEGKGGQIVEEVVEGTFKDSGTNIETIMIRMVKP